MDNRYTHETSKLRVREEEECSREPSYSTAKARKRFVINPNLKVFYVSKKSVLAFFTVHCIYSLSYHFKRVLFYQPRVGLYMGEEKLSTAKIKVW